VVFEEATAASLAGGMYHWTMICLPAGYCARMRIRLWRNTRVLGRKQRVGNAVQQAVWFGWGPCRVLAIDSASHRGSLWGERQPRHRAAGGDYFQVLALGAGRTSFRSAIVLLHGGRGFDGDCMLVNCVGRFWIFHSNIRSSLARLISRLGDWRGGADDGDFKLSTV